MSTIQNALQILPFLLLAGLIIIIAIAVLLFALVLSLLGQSLVWLGTLLKKPLQTADAVSYLSEM